MVIEIFVKIIIGVAYGFVLTFLSLPISKKLILNRSEDPGDTLALKDKRNIVLIALAGVASSVAMMLLVKDNAELVRNMLLLIPMLSIALVDSLIRKIPNSLLLTMIIMQGGYLAYICIVGKTTQPLVTSALGFFIGFVGCTLPSILRIPVGAGDVKYSAVIGLCIYFTGYVQAMMVMGVSALLLLVALKITKKGGLKTMVPMGPLLSLGSVITMCYPMLNSLVALNDVF